MSTDESPQEMSLKTGTVFDPSQLLELGKVSPTVRNKLMGLIGNVVERGPGQIRDARQAWNEGRIEESARILHTMQGTVGTLGATRFAAAALNLERAIQAQKILLVPGLFRAAEEELSATLAAARALLLREAWPGATAQEGESNAETAVPGADPDRDGREERKVPEWYEDIRANIKSIFDDVRQLKDDVKDQAAAQLFDQAVASLPSCLVVEDDELIAHVLVHLLKREGYRVRRCADGREARQAIEQAGQPPGLILLDVMLPYADGYELIHVIREQRHWVGVPIVMLTAKQQEKDIVRALDAGATDYVVKPFQPNELMARLRRILSERKTK
ncbi:MAG: response regulator [Betaproteobacteria bacterium]|nr:response regulator [Betaproteobacteria bacterium]